MTRADATVEHGRLTWTHQGDLAGVTSASQHLAHFFAVIVTVYLAFCRDFTAARMHIDLASSCHHQVYVHLRAVCVGIVWGAAELWPRRPIFFHQHDLFYADLGEVGLFL